MERRERLGEFDYTWDEGCFPLGGDSLALGGFATVRPGWRVCDLGCGAGLLGILLLAREGSLRLTGVELDGGTAARARRNLEENGLEGEIVSGDLRLREHLPPAGSCDLVISNPPYFAPGTGRSGGNARMEHACTLEDLCAAAGYLLKNGGRFALVHRPERLCDLFCALRERGMEPKRLRLVRHGPAHPPSAALVEAVCQGKPGLDILPDPVR